MGMNKEGIHAVSKWQGNMKHAPLGSNLFHSKSKLEKCGLTTPTRSEKTGKTRG